MSRPIQVPTEELRQTVSRALAEDVGGGDLTAALIPTAATAEAQVICRDAALICGQPWFDETFRQLDPAINIEWQVAEGERVEADQLLCRLQGPARAMLTGERTALNFLQTLSGVASLASRYAAAVAGTRTRILDTRKTLPGLRLAQKYAVAQGGCRNHRIGLYDGILIKENHIMAAGGIGPAVAAAQRLNSGVAIEVEVENLEEVREALSAGADILLLDNFSLDELRQAVSLNQDQARLEASGGISLERIPEIAATGVDYISVGALTKDLQSVDLSMRFRIRP